MLVFLLSLFLVLMNWSNVIVTTVCARLLVAFMFVDATVRLAVPTLVTCTECYFILSRHWFTSQPA